MNKSKIRTLDVLPRRTPDLTSFLSFNQIFLDRLELGKEYLDGIARRMQIAFQVLAGPVDRLLVEELFEIVVEMCLSVYILFQDNLERVIILFGDFVTPAEQPRYLISLRLIFVRNKHFLLIRKSKHNGTILRLERLHLRHFSDVFHLAIGVNFIQFVIVQRCDIFLS